MPFVANSDQRISGVNKTGTVLIILLMKLRFSPHAGGYQKSACFINSEHINNQP